MRKRGAMAETFMAQLKFCAFDFDTVKDQWHEVCFS